MNACPQIALAGASGTADIDTLTRQVLAQLQSQQPASNAPLNHHQQSRPAPPPASQKHPLPARHHPIRPPTPARRPAPLSPGEEDPSPASPMDADTPPRARQPERGREGGAGDMAVATPEGSGASAAAARLERLHFDD
jgi:hypothetical protein